MLDEYPTENSKLKGHKTTIILFGIFLVVLFVVIYTSLSGNFSMIGSTVNEGNYIEGIPVLAELTSVPNISLDGKFNQILLRGGSDSFLYVGDQKFELNSNADITLINFDGVFSFRDNTISELKGKASRVSVNNVPVFPKSGGALKISLENDFNYYFLEISDGVFIKKINYLTSGKIILNSKTTINLDNENIFIKDFYGNLRILNNELKLQGSLKSLDTSGEQKISISV